jgi:Ca2+ transporting ATPase
MTPLQAKL